MSDLTEFLLARIDEDEAVARAMIEDDDDGDDNTGLEGMFDDLTTPGGVLWLRGALADEFAAFLVRYAVPRRVLAECTAKRAIVWRLGPLLDRYSHAAERACTDEIAAAEDVLSDLATVYADHPDYDPSWVA